MGAIELLSRLIKLGLSNISKLSAAAKLILVGGLAFLLKVYFKPAPQRIIEMAFTDFFHPLNLSSLDWIKVYPSFLMARDKFKNILQTGRSGVPTSLLFQKLKPSQATIQFNSGAKPGMFSSDGMLLLLSFAISAVISYFIFNSGSENKKPSKPTQGIKFDDIIGLESAKTSLKEVIDYMVEPEKYKKLGARMRKGVLLYGPPGTGKTTLAKACANEAKVPFYSCNAAEFCEIYVGMGPKKVRNIFQKAKKHSPSVIFIDELDAFGSRANEFNFMENGNSEKNSTINQMLSELDGFESSDRVLVIGATNRLEMVDRSLTRAGRFDLKIHTGLPTMEERVLIFKQYLKNKKHNISENFLTKTLQKWGHPSGADIEALLNQSIYQSMRRGSEMMEDQDVQAALASVGFEGNHRL